MMDKYSKEKEKLLKLAISQQQEAANPRKSVWVEASAGTGKTKILSDRVLRLLLKKIDPAKLLCLTYTKAAAVEMSERIAKRLSSWAVEDDDSLREDLVRLLGQEFNEYPDQELLNFSRTLFATLLDTPGGMKIQTIHSFCQDILKRFPLEAGISPYFEVLDDRNAREILQNIKSDLLKYDGKNANSDLVEAVSYLTNSISEYKFPEILNMITENRGKISNLLKKHSGNISSVISSLETHLDVRLDMSEESLKQDIFDHIDFCQIKEVVKALLCGSAEDINKAHILERILNEHIDYKFYDQYKSIFLTEKGTIRSRLATQKAIKICPHIVEFMRNQAEILLKVENQLASLCILKSTIAFLHVAKNIIDKYNSYKSLYAVLDYDDLIATTRSLLENRSITDWVLFKLDGGIDHILIDEAQDTSPDQWAIIRALSQEFFAGEGRHEDKDLKRTIFVVGDRKQSIYSFQGADPREFDKMYLYFQKKIQSFAKVQLDVSFRSTKAIMDCVNILFETEQAKYGVVPQAEHISHRPYRLGDGGRVEILPLLHTDKSTNDNDYNWHLPIKREKTISLSNILARQIAQKIKNMVDSKELLASRNRPICYGDFMFLVQRRNSFVEEFVRACKTIGVQVAGIDKLKLLDQIAVQDLISLGKFLLLPTDDLSLAEALKSPIFGLSDDDLFNLCYQRNCSLFSNLLKHSSYAEIATQLKTLLNMVGYVRPFELFNYILVQMNGRKNFIARMGTEVEDILDEFLNLTIIFEQQHTPCLQTFITWIVQDEVVVQKEMEQGEDDTVKIMTVHGSKGLQSPIVILADTTRIKNKIFKNEPLWDDDLVYFPLSASKYNETCKQIKNKDFEKDLQEYHRLLYVALTRAEDRLYIAGYTKDQSANDESWYKLLENSIVSNIELPKQDQRIIYEVKQENIFTEESLQIPDPLPSFDYNSLLTPAPIENPLAKPLAPSRDDSDETEISSSPLSDNGTFYRRGIVIHKLLQYIFEVDESKRYDVANAFLSKQLPDFSSTKINSIAHEVINLCQKYREIFTSNSMAEVPIIGELNGRIVSAKIDRLVVCDKKVIIVDYKTNRPAAKTINDVPALYIKQLSTYKALIKNIYPTKDVETYILWTNTCHMMKL